jgi:hypothetical protein
MQVADQHQRLSAGRAGQKGDRSHDVHVLLSVQQAVDHLGAALVHDDLRVQPMLREDALLDADESRRMIGRVRRADANRQRGLRMDGNRRGQQRRADQ